MNPESILCKNHHPFISWPYFTKINPNKRPNNLFLKKKIIKIDQKIILKSIKVILSNSLGTFGVPKTMDF